jgi:hypothetical protein
LQVLGEPGDLLVQGRDLGRQIGERLEQIDRLMRQRRRLLWCACGSWHESLCWELRKRSTVGNGDQKELVRRHPFDACISRVRLKRERLQGQPVTKGFRINSQQTTTLAQRHDGHE